MNAAQIDSTYKAAISFLLAGKLKPAFDKTRLLVDELQWGEIHDRFNDLQQNYRFLLRYFISGAEDPERKSIYNKIIAKLIVLNSKLREELMMRNSTAFEFVQKRYYPHKLHFSTPDSLFDSLNYFHRQTGILEEAPEYNENEGKRLRLNYEKLLPDLFFISWLSTSFEASEKNMIRQIMEQNYPGEHEKCLVVSALTLNLWRMFDEEKLMILLEACQHPNVQIKQRALVGLCFILTRYNQFIPYFPGIRNRLMVLTDDNHTIENIRNIIFLIIGTNDTDRISKKMQEEILPEMMKISPLLKDRMENENLLKSEDWDEENPEWQDILEESGIADKLQELTELQLEGADVYMSTFSMLKNFPFFNETAHWFLPFDPAFSAVNELFGNQDKTLLSAFLGNSAICNSDKYSFCLSILQMPSGQRDMMSKSFKAEAAQIEEMAKDESILKPDIAARNIARQYIQDLFRFFRLHPEHADIQDMFNYSLNIHQTGFFEILSSDSDIKTHVAEYYFTKNHYPQAVSMFTELIKEQEPSAALYQKTGFAYQKTSRIQEALDAYLKADMIQPDDIWTVKKIALCHRLSGNYEKALENYRHADFLQPGKYNTRMQIANCLIALENYKEALTIYAELENNDPDNENIWRAICWCALISGNIFQAEYYIEKILSAVPEAVDYLNAGHIALCLKKRQQAIGLYQKSLGMQNNNLDLLSDQIRNDRKILIKNNVNEEEILLMIDELYFLSE